MYQKLNAIASSHQIFQNIYIYNSNTKHREILTLLKNLMETCNKILTIKKEKKE
jgi:hypothetical protein